MKKILKNKGFTLAEVLITLVIIGVIAALTIPALMANHRKQEVSARLKKFYSNLSNAVRLTDIENPGFMRSTDNDRTSSNYGNWWNETIGKSMPVTEKSNTNYKVFSTSDSSGYKPDKLYFLNDGTMLFPREDQNWSNDTTELYFDINGEKAPNTYGKDIFLLEIHDSTGSCSGWIQNTALRVCGGTACYNLGQTNYKYDRNIVRRQCESGDPSDCTILLQHDGWEVKEDYPHL